jgi:hypothetical protein
MTVYVDDMRLAARVGTVEGVWSHLMADSSDELRRFAAALGLRPEWIQYPGTPKEHFDVTDRVRRAALRAGAVEIGWGEAGHLTLAKARGEVFDLAAVRERALIESGGGVQAGLW